MSTDRELQQGIRAILAGHLAGEPLDVILKIEVACKHARAARQQLPPLSDILDVVNRFSLGGRNRLRVALINRTAKQEESILTADILMLRPSNLLSVGGFGVGTMRALFRALLLFNVDLPDKWRVAPRFDFLDEWDDWLGYPHSYIVESLGWALPGAEQPVPVDANVLSALEGS